MAAITGAGYAAKYLQNFSRDKDGFSGLTSTSSVSRKPETPSLIPHFEENAAFLQKSVYRRSDQQQPSYGGNVNLLDVPNVETASTSGFEGEVSDTYGEGFDMSARPMGKLRGHRRGQNSLRSRHNHLQYPKGLNSLESCLMAQICKEHSKMEDRVLAPLPSPCVPAFRPFVVTDGTRVISRPSFDSCSVQVRDNTKKVVHLEAFPEINEMVFGGIPQLPERGSGEGSKERNVTKLSSSRETPNEMQMYSQGPQSGAALFCLGVSIGITYSTLANKSEVTKLKDVLKQAENLVQDLQEELEMNDSVTVKELVSVNKDNVFLYEHVTSIDNEKLMAAHLQTNSEVLINYGVEKSDTHKAPENLESMNQIEAELEAELERLELNLKVSTLPAKPSDDDDNELDADMAELVQGEFRAEIGSSSSTSPCSPKQGVSPRDLSLRLHQVIQSRLEQRIMELETALKNSQKRVKHLESEQGFFSHNDASSSFSSSVSRGSPIAIEAERELPLVMNLSGEALDAYNEAFEELHMINELNFDEHNSAIYKESQEEEISHKSMFELGPTLVDDESQSCGNFDQREMFSFDDDDDEDDDTTLLIKQIVAKTRQGSSAILHAHRAMVSLDSNEK